MVIEYHMSSFLSFRDYLSPSLFTFKTSGKPSMDLGLRLCITANVVLSTIRHPLTAELFILSHLLSRTP